MPLPLLVSLLKRECDRRVSPPQFPKARKTIDFNRTLLCSATNPQFSSLHPATLPPIRKRLCRRFPCRHNQLSHQFPPPQKLFQHLLNRVSIVLVPFRRNL